MDILRYTFTCLFGATFFIGSAFAETRVSGNVSGRWARNGNPYIATGDLTIRDNQSLQVEAGVEIRFEGNFFFFVYGELSALGDEGDSIRFDVAPGGEAWGGLRLLSSERTRLDYCVLTNGRALHGEAEIDTVSAGGNVFISGGDVMIDNSRVSRGRARTNGGGVAIWHGAPVIRNSIISDNESMSFGGGVSVVAGSNPVLTNCIINNNTSVAGGGGAFIFNESDPLFDKCTFENNDCTNGEVGNGGGVFVAEASSPRFSKTDFLENSASAGGGAYIRGVGSDPNFEWCYFWGNSTNIGSRVGGAVYVRGEAAVSIAYTRFVENNSNQGGALYVKQIPRLKVDHCLFLRNAATRAGGAIAASTDLGDTPLVLNNCTLIDNRNIGVDNIANTAYARRPVEGQPGSRILFNSSIIYGPTPLFAEEDRIQARYSNIINGFNGVANTFEDPGFFASDSVWFLLSGDSRSIDTGDTLLPLDSDRSRTDRGWLYFPHNAWETLPDEPLSVNHTTDDHTTLDFTYMNETNVPIYVTPMDRWNEGARELSVDVSTLTGDNEIEAVAWTTSGFYIAGGNKGDDPNVIYHVDDSLRIRGQYNQPGGPDDAGFTELATDGESILYGCANDQIVEFTTDGEYGQDYGLPGGLEFCRAIGCDFNYSDDFVDFYTAGDDGFLVRADAGMSEIRSIDVGDSVLGIGVKGNTRAVYIITRTDDDKAMLWLVSIDDERTTPLYALDLPEGYTPGGMEVNQQYFPGRGSMIGIMKGEGDLEDKLYVLDLYVSWLIIQPKLTLLMPGERMTWPIEFAGDQMPPGSYDDNFYLAVNGYGLNGEVAAHMQSDPGSVGDKKNLQPNSVALSGPYPNPFNSEARINFSLAHAGFAEVWITDINGRAVSRVTEGFFASGDHSATVNALDLPTGQYYIRLTLSESSIAKPMTLIR